MSSSHVKRKLVAILAADAVGFSRQMGRDEERTAKVLAAHRAVIDGIIEFHEGRIVGTAGDSVLAEFASPVQALRCAVEIQAAIRTRNDALPDADRMQFRIGVNLGDVMVKGDDLLGDGVNVAARLESMAEPGGICISSSVYDQIAGKLDLGFVELGEQKLKNIERPIRVYRVNGGAPREAAGASPTRKRRGFLPVAGGVAIAAAIAAGVWLTRNEQAPPPAPVVANAPAAPSDQEMRRAAELEKARLETELAKARAEAEIAKARAAAADAQRKAAADVAAARSAAPPARQPVQAAMPAPAPPAADWTAQRACEKFEDLKMFSDAPAVRRVGDEYIVERGKAGEPGHFVVSGRPEPGGRLMLSGRIVSIVAATRGRELPARFAGRLDGDRYVLEGRIGRRACTLSFPRAPA